MRVLIDIDSKAVLNPLKELGQERQGPFVLSRSLNMLAKKVQTNLRKDFETNLSLRRKAWVLQQVRIGKEAWSTKTRLKVVIAVTETASFVWDMEDGNEHYPINGKKYLVFPNAKAFGKRIIGNNDVLKIKNLNLHQTPHGIQGNQRTFMVNSSASGTPLVLQRVAKDAAKSYRRGVKKSGTIRLLYTLIRHSKRPKKIHWYDTAETTVRKEQYGIFTDVISKALKDARK